MDMGAILSAIISAVVIGAGVYGFKRLRDWKDSQAIYNFLLASKEGTSFDFRSTAAISSHTKISEKRVADLCSKHPKIRRNEKQKQSWKLTAP